MAGLLAVRRDAAEAAGRIENNGHVAVTLTFRGCTVL